MTVDEKKNLLFFSTGCDRAPIKGRSVYALHAICLNWLLVCMCGLLLFVDLFSVVRMHAGLGHLNFTISRDGPDSDRSVACCRERAFSRLSYSSIPPALATGMLLIPCVCFSCCVATV
jgi:hypothetical protein